MPRKDWSDVLRSASLASLVALARSTAGFFQSQLAHAALVLRACGMAGGGGWVMLDARAAFCGAPALCS